MKMLIALYAFAQVTLPSAATAQVSETLVSPDRGVVPPLTSRPYQQVRFPIVGAKGCADYSCTTLFDKIPAGYRLEIKFISVNWTAYNSTPRAAVYVADKDANPYVIVFPQTRDGRAMVASAPVTFFIEPGHTPSVTISGGTMSGGGAVTIVGTLQPL